jgi:iron-sulfur cluster assembly protein
MENFISLTENAQNKAKNFLSEYTSDYFIRVSVKGGGCSGLTHELSYDNFLSDKDIINEINDVRIVTDKKSFIYLMDTILDYSDGLNGKGFTFSNKNWQRECGCGESFSI